MKTIGILSDTHSYFDEKIFSFFEHCDEIWHAGDFGNVELSEKLSEFKPLRGVYGNIDGQDIRKIHPHKNMFLCEEVNVYMTHIGGYPGKYHPKIKPDLIKYQPALFICGHSHILKVIHDPKLKLLHINPGAMGKEGFHTVRTMIRLKITEKRIHDLEVIELKK